MELLNQFYALHKQFFIFNLDFYHLMIFQNIFLLVNHVYLQVK